jgi:hypothetical protein
MSKFEIYVMMKFCSQFYTAWARKKPVFSRCHSYRRLQNSGIEGITTGNVNDFVSFNYAFFCPSSTRFLKINNRLFGILSEKRCQS